jgi:hypothetical protein
MPHRKFNDGARKRRGRIPLSQWPIESGSANATKALALKPRCGRRHCDKGLKTAFSPRARSGRSSSEILRHLLRTKARE